MGSFPTDVAASFGLDAAFPSSNGQSIHDTTICKRCQHPGCDVRFLDCGCSLHARCTPMAKRTPVTECPVCRSPVRNIFLMPMNFDEIDQAKAAAANMALSSKRGKKRKNATIARLNPANAQVEESCDGADQRTGRWTTEETLYCDKLIEAFDTGELPVADGAKLNDFLASMLKSKQSRLTKKMKNARLSAKTYKYTSGCISSLEDAHLFSQLEKSFYDSIQCDLERAEIRFHMQKEWRELFSTFCVSLGQKLDADSWLSSVEEMDRRASQAKDAARMARRKVMMGYALSQDSMNPEKGVFIEHHISNDHSSDALLANHASSDSLAIPREKRRRSPTHGARSLRDFSSPFVGKIIQYIHRHQVPFEHIDAWVPSFVPSGQQSDTGGDQKCRLCFAGFASTETQIPPDGGRPVELSSQDEFDLLSFGEYSSKFSFDVGCGLPGRVYSSGVCSWEQGVANAPSNQFERCGGASQWGIKTVLGIPIPSPNVGRIVVLLYSRHDRTRDAEMVKRITEELTKLMPTPKWKLVVDVGAAPPKPDNPSETADKRIAELIKLIAEHIPTHRNSPHAPYLPGFTSLRLLLVKECLTERENDLMSTILESYSSYLTSGRRNSEVAWMIARDYMLLTQSNNQLQQHQSTQHLQLETAQQINQLQPTSQLQLPQQLQVHQQPAQLQLQAQHLQLHQQQMQPLQLQSSQPQSQSHISQVSSISQLQSASNVHQQITLGLQQFQHSANALQLGDPYAASSTLQPPKQAFAPAQAPTGTLHGQIRLNGNQLNGQIAPTQLAPNPSFSLQQSAFQPISHPHHSSAHQQT